jgi:hypothetical protein
MSNKKEETVISKRLCRKQKIEDHEYTKIRKWNQEYQVPVPLVAPILLLLLPKRNPVNF